MLHELLPSIAVHFAGVREGALVSGGGGEGALFKVGVGGCVISGGGGALCWSRFAFRIEF